MALRVAWLPIFRYRMRMDLTRTSSIASWPRTPRQRSINNLWHIQATVARRRRALPGTHRIARRLSAACHQGTRRTATRHTRHTHLRMHPHTCA